MAKKHFALSKKDIREWVDSRSFTRGMAYFENDVVYNKYKQGNTLSAKCSGSQEWDYELRVELGEKKILFAECSCPVGYDGRCKHIVALLLAWLDDPDSFKEINDIQIQLEKHNKEELIFIIQQILNRHPELDFLLEIPLPGFDKNEEPFNPQNITKQIKNILENLQNNWDVNWNDFIETNENLKLFLDLAEQYEQKGDYENAAFVYEEIIKNLLNLENLIFHDESGKLIGKLCDCIYRLDNCLENITIPEKREGIINILFKAYLWDLKAGGISDAGNIPEIFVNQASPEEMVLIRTWVETALPNLSDWALKSIGGVLLTLQPDDLEDEIYLKICRQTGRRADLIERLLLLNRLDEVKQETRQAKDYDLPGLADLIYRDGHDLLAEQLLQERLQNSNDSRLNIWLKDYYENKGELDMALDQAEKIFWLHPEVSDYFEIIRLAQIQGIKKTIRPRILETLFQNANFRLLTTIYVNENEIDKAIVALNLFKAKEKNWRNLKLEYLVAQAAAQEKPYESIMIFMEIVNYLIDQRGRENYKQASQYLMEVRDICRQTKDHSKWDNLIKTLRNKHQRLPAFQDELNQAGLL